LSVPVESVVLVDAAGRPIGTEEKLAAHRGNGKLHLAFSVLVLDRKGNLLLQRRARTKYHFRGLWSNTCCGHPRPLEETRAAAERRLHEEFGFTTPLHALGTLVYTASDPVSGLTEHEYLHVLRGEYEGPLRPDPEEIAEWQWVSLGGVRVAIAASPEHYTPWFRVLVASGYP
jgi:isopentenyl-diphosphate delta-isomerase